MIKRIIKNVSGKDRFKRKIISGIVKRTFWLSEKYVKFSG